MKERKLKSMYLIKVDTKIKTGYILCLTKKTTIKTVNTILQADCNIEVFKTFRLHHDCFGFRLDKN